jgi:threonine dehydrogenase-like Zn-dependent dehydrogenase
VHGKAETLNFDTDPIHERLMEMTGGRGPDRCIDAVGAEAHGTGSLDAVVDRAKQAIGLAIDRPHALRQAIMACRKAGSVSVPGVYFGLLDKLPFGAVVGKGLTIKTGQTHVQRYLAPLLAKIEKGEIDPSFLITHRIPLEDAPDAYEKFRTKTDGCIKVVIKPGMATGTGISETTPEEESIIPNLTFAPA